MSKLKILLCKALGLKIVRVEALRKKQRPTGWYVGVRQDRTKQGNPWICCGTVNTKADDDEQKCLEEAEVILPIPVPESLPEFDGF